MKNEGKRPVCHLCRMSENDVHGELLAFQQSGQMCCVHLNCIKYTTIIKTFEAQHSRMFHEYQNVFDVLKQSKMCSVCNKMGASISCTQGSCSQVFHYHCAISKFGWDFRRNGSNKFKCGCYRSSSPTKASTIVAAEQKDGTAGLTFQHDLFAKFGGAVKGPRVDIPGNLDISGAPTHSPQSQHSPKIESLSSVFIDDSDRNESSDGDDSFVLEENDGGQSLEVMDFPLSHDISGPVYLVRLKRASRKDLWNISFQVTKIDDSIVLTVASADRSGKDETSKTEDSASLQAKDIILSINGSKVGAHGLGTLRDILFRLKQDVDLMLEVIRKGF